MTARDKLEANDRREELFAAALWRCEVCGRPLRAGVPQLAHRITKSKANLRRYGARVIHHPRNLAPVLISGRPAEEMAAEILAEAGAIEEGI